MGIDFLNFCWNILTLRVGECPILSGAGWRKEHRTMFAPVLPQGVGVAVNF